MIVFPLSKINLGLNVVRRRSDGYHDLQTVFMAVPLSDALEVTPMDEAFPSEADYDLKVTGLPVGGDETRNLVVRAYHLLKHDFPRLPRLHAHLVKRIPIQAGMGGGSSDGTYMLRLLNEQFSLGLTDAALSSYALQLGADCPFFVTAHTAYAEGVGEQLSPLPLDLTGWWLGVVRPDIPVSTAEAFRLVNPRMPEENPRDVVLSPVESWRGRLVNDFEGSVFAQYPAIGEIKEQLYRLGATYAAMSGSGSALFGLFKEQPDLSVFPDCFTYSTRLNQENA